MAASGSLLCLVVSILLNNLPQINYADFCFISSVGLTRSPAVKVRTDGISPIWKGRSVGPVARRGKEGTRSPNSVRDGACRLSRRLQLHNVPPWGRFPSSSGWSGKWKTSIVRRCWRRYNARSMRWPSQRRAQRPRVLNVGSRWTATTGDR